MKALIQTFLAGVVGALTVTVLMGAAGGLALVDEGIRFPDGTVQVTAAGGIRRVYLTGSLFQGDQALTACTEPGFHMASMWELLDPTRLDYAKEVPTATSTDDLGDGLPAGTFGAGFVRTGSTHASTAVIGEANCEAWSSASGAGTLAKLTTQWANTSLASILQPWEFSLGSCNGSLAVWCIED